MQVLKDICSIDIDYYAKPRKLPTKLFKSTATKTYRTFLSALIIAEKPYNFLLTITPLLLPEHSEVAKEYMKDPNKYAYFVEWFLNSRSLIESQLLANYLSLGETPEGKAIIKVLEKRFRNNFNDKTIELKELKDNGSITPETQINFTLG